jgi:hypothetical protein
VKDTSTTCRDSQFFSQFSPVVFQAILDVIPAICAVLKWTPLATSFLIEIIRQISLTGDALNLKHSEFGRILWGDDVSENAARRRISRAINSVKRCQLLSGFKAVHINSGSVAEFAGKAEYFPTSYELAEFVAVLTEIQKLAGEQNMMALNQRQRKLTQFAITKSICDARNYQQVPKLARVESKEKSASVVEAESAARVNKLRHLPNEDFNAVTEAYGEALYQRLCEVGEANPEYRHIVKRVYHEIEVAVNRSREMITTQNKRENGKGSLKLVGGQLK